MRRRDFITALFGGAAAWSRHARSKVSAFGLLA
jgi:hypothetical protein